MNAYFCESKEDCLTKITELIKENSIISWGGSESVRELGILDVLSKGNYQLLDRLAAKTPDESRALFSKIVLSDYYFMSTNALTLKREFIIIDGNGIRLSWLFKGQE